MRRFAKAPGVRWLLPVLVLFALFLAWEIAARAAGADSGVPPPTAVAAALVRDSGFLGWHAGVSLFEAATAMLISVVAAFLVSSAFARSPLARTAFMPLVLLAQSIPMLAIAPLLARAIGEGIFANIVVTAYLCWFPAVIAFTHGFLNVEATQLAFFEVHRASPVQIWRRLRLPSAAPMMVAGIRTSAGLAVISAIVSEYGTLAGGLGATIVKHVRGISVLPPDTLYALVVVAALLGLGFTAFAHLLARRILRGWLGRGDAASPTVTV